jgi:hypothetical protein
MLTNRLTLPLAAAAGFAVIGVLELLHEQAQPFATVADRAIEGAFLVGLAAAAAALRELRDGRAWNVAAAGQAALALCAAATFARGEDALGPVFLLGLLATTLGLAAATARSTPRHLPAVLLAGWLLSIAAGSPLLLAAAWAAVALPPLGAARRATPAAA